MSDTNQPWFVKQGDTDPSIADTLSGDEMPPFPDGATVAFTMTRINESTATIDAADATIVSATAGTVRYDWQSGDTDVPGTYNAEWTLSWTDSESNDHILHFPNDGYRTVICVPELS